MNLLGAGIGETILTHAADWKPTVKTLPDPEMTTTGMDIREYLHHCRAK